MIQLMWLKALLKRRKSRLFGVMTGVAITVALLTLLGGFIASSDASMTKQTIRNIPVDWQVLLTPGADIKAINNAISEAGKVQAAAEVGYADAAGFAAKTGNTTQTTGPGKVVGLPADYRHLFPAEVRSLLGPPAGVLIAQQTASNLQVSIGDIVTISRIGLPPVQVKVDGVVDLPQADSFFQAVGAPAGTSPQAPPDNLILLPAPVYHHLFDPQAKVRPDTVRTQIHVKLAEQLSPSPSEAFVQAQKLANHFEAAVAGSAVVGDNLAARLDGVREDSLYTRVLFIILGLPGVLLAIFLTLAVTASGSQRRRQEQALLRIRGASMKQIVTLQSMEAVVIGIGGIAAGILLAIAMSLFLKSIHMGWDRTTVQWSFIGAAAGLLVSACSIVLPAWRDARTVSVSISKTSVGRIRKPLWRRLYLDYLFLILSVIFFWRASSTGYQLVLAPEGVVKTSVNYEAFIAPLSLWLGGTLLLMRVGNLLLERGSGILNVLFHPIAGNLSHVVSQSYFRQRGTLIKGIMLVVLAFSFAVSTSVFNTTYNSQSQVDAELTNGSDVMITGSTAYPPGNKVGQLKKLSGVSAIETMQHRFAYVGSDLQDLYGIDPNRITDVSTLSDSYFGSGSAKTTLKALANTPDGLLVSQETIDDYQLQPGDTIHLRLQTAKDHQYHVVPFHLVGMVKEFPTAPKDSFLVANASYIAAQTGNTAQEIVMMKANGAPIDLAREAVKAVSDLPGAKVTDVGSVQNTISSSLTAVNVSGLTKLELGFALLMIAWSTGVILALGMAERRRTYSILTALGAKKKQLGSFIWSEGILILSLGAIFGCALGFGEAQMFVKVLTGVFDPPPDYLQIPWSYLMTLIIFAVLSTMTAVWGAIRMARQGVVKALRNTNLSF
ncbi:ABC transporter permease [Paenibacillus sp. sptzw28]|uniref:ABC transporter permease n=1 Tax=Paenibacillus sp. sptzw28 TaxID=715179 RepID=UPI001C6F484E|nr:ABC transporter permease [Paenibacillus sp. sptzw28]QYR19347.1 ABC transporter permease [Paenibacillus sp. sptzw28]